MNKILKQINLYLLKDFFLLIIGLILFLFLAFRNILFPPFTVDEFYISGVTKNIINFYPPSLIFGIENYILTNTHKFIVMMLSSYTGGIRAYLYYPFLLIGGVNQEAFRIGSLFYSSLLLIVIYFWAKGWFGRKVAFINHLLLSTNVVFIQFARLAMPREEIYQLLWFFMSLIMFWKYYISNRKIFLFLGMFVVGIGLSDKLMFLWFIFAVVVSSLVMKSGRKFIKRIFDLKFSEFLTMLLCFCAGFLPYLYSVFSSKGEILIKFLIKKNTLMDSNYNNFILHLKNIMALLNADIVSLKDTVFFLFKSSPKDYITSSLVMISCIVLFYVYKNGKSFKKRIFTYKLYFIGTVLLGLIFVSFFNFNKQNLGYLFVLLPFFILMISIVLQYIFNTNKKGIFIVIAIISIYLLSNLIISEKFNFHFKDMLMKKNSNDSLAKYLMLNMINRPVILNGDFIEVNYVKDKMNLWHIKENILFFSNYKIIPEIFNLSEIFKGDILNKYIDNSVFIIDNDYVKLIEKLNTICLDQNIQIEFLYFFDNGVNKLSLFKLKINENTKKS